VSIDPPPEVRVLCDLTISRGIVEELIANALAFSAEDLPVRVSVQTPQADPAHVRFVVEDSGPGLPTGERDASFHAFTNVRPAGFEESGGAGLGLWIAHTHAVAQGGRLSMAAREAGGTMLTFALPREGGGS